MTFLAGVNKAIVNPFITLLIALAAVYFLWGMAQFVMNSSDAGSREEGKRKIIWGLVGLAIMVSVYGILNIVLGTFGANPPAGIINNDV
jgi:hypothetical protein